MIAMAASELDETNGEDRGARECTPLTPEFGYFVVCPVLFPQNAYQNFQYIVPR